MGNRLFVGNIPWNTTEENLREIFSQNGRTVGDVRIPTDRETGKPRGFAFISLQTDKEAQDAMEELDGQDLDGRAMRVNEAESKPPRGSSGPRRSFDGDSGGGGGRDFGGPPEGGGDGGKQKGDGRKDRNRRRQQKGYGD